MFKFVLSALILASAGGAQAIDIPKGFTQETVQVPGVKLNVYKGGTGSEVLVLLHGYAESALMWQPAMVRFQSKYTILVPDLRGAGLSETPKDGYTKAALAQDIKKLLEHYKIEKAYIVGHDIGLMVAYAFAAQYPETTLKLVVMDAFLPGVGPGDDVYNSPDIWHFRFHGPFAEKLVKGREKLYLDALWTGFSADPKSFPEAKKDYFAKQYAAPGHMKAGFEYFRTFPQDAIDNKKFAATKLTMPVLSVGGEKALGQVLADTMKVVAPQVQAVVLKNTGHWLMEENPKEALDALENFLK
jgi:pimeloyl-ACP methyl ester carboxylesterase